MSQPVHIKPVKLNQPDLRKLARALLLLVTEQQRTVPNTKSSDNPEVKP